MFKEVRLNDGLDPAVGPNVSLTQLQARIAQASAQLPPLLERAWVPGAELNGQSGEGGRGLHTLRFMNFNILAEGLSSGGPSMKPPFPTDQQGKHVKVSSYGGFDAVPEPQEVLDWARVRRWRLLEEIFRVSPDVLAIEECDNYANFFEPALAKAGYRGAFVPKQDSPSLTYGFYSDGVALFWKHDTLRLVDDDTTGSGSGLVPLKAEQCPCPHLIATLRHERSGRAVVVATTHLKAKTGAANEFKRDRQIAAVLEELGESADVIKKADAEAAAVHALLDEPPERGELLTYSTLCFGRTKTQQRPNHNSGKVGQQPPRVPGDERGDGDASNTGTTTNSRNVAPVIKSRFSAEPLMVLMGDFNADAYADEEEPSAAEKKDEDSSPPIIDDVPSSVRRASSVESVESSWTNATADQPGCSNSNEAPGSLAVPRVTSWREGYLASVYPLAESLAACVACQWDLRRGGSWSTWKRRGSYEARHQIDYIFVSQAQESSSSRHHEHKKGSSIQTKKGADAAIADDAPVRKSRVVQVLAPPKDSDVPPSRLPCAAYPSDHLCIAADIAFD